jgi:hypothetical protein
MGSKDRNSKRDGVSKEEYDELLSSYAAMQVGCLNADVIYCIGICRTCYQQ